MAIQLLNTGFAFVQRKLGQQPQANHLGRKARVQTQIRVQSLFNIFNLLRPPLGTRVHLGTEILRILKNTWKLLLIQEKHQTPWQSWQPILRENTEASFHLFLHQKYAIPTSTLCAFSQKIFSLEINFGCMTVIYSLDNLDGCTIF